MCVCVYAYVQYINKHNSNHLHRYNFFGCEKKPRTLHTHTQNCEETRYAYSHFCKVVVVCLYNCVHVGQVLYGDRVYCSSWSSNSVNVWASLPDDVSGPSKIYLKRVSGGVDRSPVGWGRFATTPQVAVHRYARTGTS